MSRPEITFNWGEWGRGSEVVHLGEVCLMVNSIGGLQ